MKHRPGLFTMSIQVLDAMLAHAWKLKSGSDTPFGKIRRSPEVNRRAKHRMKRNAIAAASRKANRNK